MKLLQCLLLAFSFAIPSAVVAQDSASDIVEHLAQFRFDQLGHPQIASDSIRPALAPASNPHKLLVLPVRFTDKQYDRFEQYSDQDDRNRAYFQDLLFGEGANGPRVGTLSHYYRHQSRGLYNITGDIHPVVELSKPLSHYGRPVQASDGSWRSDENAHDLVKEALNKAYLDNPDFAWEDYDQWDPQDFDEDGKRDEPDGYIDHLVLVIAGMGQSACQGLFKIDEKLTPNSAPTAVSTLSADEQECVNRIWPHRSTMSANLGRGPQVAEQENTSGGVDIGNGLWVRDYNIQSEYTDISTFIHEFGHSLGLPDIYARQTNNSTGSWEAMSSTTDPEPQELSAWSRMVLGWMQPCVVRAPELGGDRAGQLYLKTMNEWDPKASDPAKPSEACDAAMVILPPKYRDIQLGVFDQNNGEQAAYSGQGNDMLRSLTRTFDLSQVTSEVHLEFDTWFEIEAEWDYLYVEAAASGEAFKRLLPTDKEGVADKQSIMPAGKGHNGPSSRPGFTGLSGDMDGDNKVESAVGCDPGKDRVLAEEQVSNTEKDPCSVAKWVHAEFDLGEYVGKVVTIRFTYFTDGAAVENGALLDNVQIKALGFFEDFEDESINGWQNTGFSLSSGAHHLAVPHYYLLEFRDPYAQFSHVTNYDKNLVRTPGFSFYPEGGEMKALNVNYRPGVVMWYANGSYLWSQNDPAQFGPGNGFLLVVDSTPQEFQIPGVPEQYYRQEGDFTWYEFDQNAQPWLEKAYLQTMCFQRRQSYYPVELVALAREHCDLEQHPAVESLYWQGRRLLYGYTLRNTLLPGAERAGRKSNGSLFDTRIRKGETQFRLYDRALRNFHAADAPFAVEEFASGLETYAAVDGEMRLENQRPFTGVNQFSDEQEYQNPHLPFGGVDVPTVGFSYELESPGRRAPGGSRVKIKYRWVKQTN